MKYHIPIAPVRFLVWEALMGRNTAQTGGCPAFQYFSGDRDAGRMTAFGTITAI
jgi:hypothetical protein